MTFAEFKTAYLDIFTRMMSYKPSECGSNYYAEKLAVLSDAYPKFESQMESEING